MTQTASLEQNLMKAISKWDTGLVRSLLEGGADPNFFARDMSPLLSAVYWEGTEITQLLLDHGANVNIRNSHGQTPLHNAFQNAFQYERPPNIECIQILIASGADINASDNAGRTPLMHALDMGVDMAEDASEGINALLDAGADIFITNSEGRGAYDIVCDASRDNIYLHHPIRERLRALYESRTLDRQTPESASATRQGPRL